jgi:antitoxin component HigA of HigAB toxin-antitoxin module
MGNRPYRPEQVRRTSPNCSAADRGASEIMHGSVKRLSITQIRRLHEEWKIPAEVLIRDVA